MQFMQFSLEWSSVCQYAHAQVACIVQAVGFLAFQFFRLSMVAVIFHFTNNGRIGHQQGIALFIIGSYD